MLIICKPIKCNEFIFIKAQIIYVEPYKPFNYFPTYEYSYESLF